MKADICYSYQILKNHEILDERIIVLMIDDIVNNEENLTPGIVINHPNGNDVYKAGVGSGKVRKSGPSNHVFVYFADHGAPCLIAFPEDELSAMDLNRTINYMYENNVYEKMIICIEACESGSMFENILPNNTTAANSEESSYACYFDDKRDTYLGDSYSVHWMEDSDQEVLTETLQKQYKIVKKETTESHAQEFGDMSFAQLHVSSKEEKIQGQSLCLKWRTLFAAAMCTLKESRGN
ncbi:legumain [Trichonephila inaurata madagascariensis]|uniref:Legumain n=1 Tax=Trichonephila inaurata madagascariensis TaxID=2747483 RepID=A0A8X6IEH7_9ARAC|nr:legumain [Trichonephila inaurata madagascariensis]